MRDKKIKPQIIFAHSQGATFISEAISELPPNKITWSAQGRSYPDALKLWDSEPRRNIKRVYTYGGAAFNYPDLGYGTEYHHFISNTDAIPMMAGRFWNTQNTFNDSIGKPTYRADGTYLGPTYDLSKIFHHRGFMGFHPVIAYWKYLISKNEMPDLSEFE